VDTLTHSKVTTSVVLVDSDMAARWLQLNTRNRAALARRAASAVRRSRRSASISASRRAIRCETASCSSVMASSPPCSRVVPAGDHI